MSQFINPNWLVFALEKSGERSSIPELRQSLEDYLPHPSPKSRKRMITYILGLLEIRGDEGRIRETPLLRLFNHLNDKKTKLELVYWQVLKKLPYALDFALFLSQNIEKEKIPREEARKFLYSLMGKESPTTFGALLSLLENFNLIQRGSGTILLRYHSPSPIAFSFALCEDMLRDGRVTLELDRIDKEKVPRIFFMNGERALHYIEDEGKLWQLERRPPLNRILLLARSIDEVVEYLKTKVKDYEKATY